MARKKKETQQSLDEPENTTPLPVEAEEARAQLRWAQVASLVLGVVFLVVLVWMIYVTYTAPGFPIIFPALAMAYFGVAGVSDLVVGVTAPSGSLRLWRQGKYAEGSEYLSGWRGLIAFVPGGIVPGLFMHNARTRVHPLVELEQGGVPPPSGGYPGPMVAAPGPGPSGPVMMAPMGAPAAADNVAPDPFGGRPAVARPPAQPTGPAPSTPASLWARPNVAPRGSSAGGQGPGTCRACGTPLDAGSRFCKSCGAAISG